MLYKRKSCVLTDLPRHSRSGATAIHITICSVFSDRNRKCSVAQRKFHVCPWQESLLPGGQAHVLSRNAVTRSSDSQTPQRKASVLHEDGGLSLCCSSGQQSRRRRAIGRRSLKGRQAWRGLQASNAEPDGHRAWLSFRLPGSRLRLHVLQAPRPRSLESSVASNVQFTSPAGDSFDRSGTFRTTFPQAASMRGRI